MHENALSTLAHEARERAFAQTDELLVRWGKGPAEGCRMRIHAGEQATAAEICY